jgi:hypothetical protein
MSASRDCVVVSIVVVFCMVCYVVCSGMPIANDCMVSFYCLYYRAVFTG